MARKRCKRPRTTSPQKQESAEWTHEQEVEALAWLDYNLDQGMDAEVFKSTVSVHLEKTCQVKYTIYQIERKIERIWWKNGTHDAKHWTAMYKRGTGCLQPSAMIEEIHKRVKVLKHEEFEGSFRKRRLRSASRGKETKPAHISIAVEIPSPRRTRRERPNAGGKKEISNSNRRQLLGAERICTPQRLLKQEDQNDALLLPPSSQRTVADSEEGLTVEEDDDNNSVDTPTGRFRQATLGALSAGEDRVESSEDGETHSRETTPSAERPDENVTDRKIKLLERRCQSLERELEYEQQKHEGDTMFLRERVRLVEEGCKKLESEIACLNYVRREQSRAGEASIRSTLIDQAKQIAQLEQSLADRKWLRTFSTLSSTDSVPLDVRDIRADIDVLGHHIKQILAKYEDRVVCSTTSFYKEDDLRSLICRAFGQDILQPAELIGQTINLSTFSLQAVIRSLTAAALCEWVFECSLQEICAKPCALLREYRLHLARQDGDIALRNLDFAAHKSLIKGNFFQHHVVPQKASVLADRLSQALSPLIACQEQCEQVHTYSVEAWYEEKSRLLEIFGQALKVKANLVVSTDLFGMVMYTPGTLFDENFMMTESMAFSGTRQPCHEPPQVALCLMPSLQLYEYDRRIVDYNSFSRMDTNPKEARCVFNKALVITENLDKPIAAVR